MKLDRDDRIFYTVLPVLAYAAMAIAAPLAHRAGTGALEILAVSLVALLIIGMRNAWDMTSFMVTREKRD
jgi:hypothetical protein